MRRTILVLVIAGAIILCCSGGSVDEDNPDAADWKSFSDEKVLEYLDNPFAGVRLYAGQEILRRWDEKKIIALCEKNWKRGCEVLASGSWPAGGAALETYLLGRTRPDRTRDAALLLAGRRFPDNAAYDGPVGSQVRDIWFVEWVSRIPHSVFFVGTVDLCLKHGWIRERLYRDDDWIGAWGAWRNSTTGAITIGWQLREYRAVVALLADDPLDPKVIAGNQFLEILASAVKTGRNTAAEFAYTTSSKTHTDLLGTTINLPNVGPVAYGYLVAIVCDRPDWIPAIDKRLADVEHTYAEMENTPSGPRFVEKVTHQDRRSALIAMLSDAGQGRREPVKAALKAYWRREWRGYDDTTFAWNLWLRHPWAAKIMLDKDFAAWYEQEDRKLVGEPDVAFLRGGW